MIENILKNLKKKGKVYLSGIWGSPLDYVIALIEKEINSNIIIIENEKRVTEIKKNLEFFLGKDSKYNIILFPEYDFFTSIENNRKLATERIKILNDIINNSEKKVIITTLKNILSPVMPLQILKKSRMIIKNNEEYDFENLKKKLIEYNYQYVTRVFNKGEFSIRGDIIDIFSPNYENPIRIEFFDYYIEDIRFFNSITQKSVEKIEKVDIIPASEIIFTDSVKNNFKTYLLNIKKSNTNKLKKAEKLWNNYIIDEKEIDKLISNADMNLPQFISFSNIFYKSEEYLYHYFSNFIFVIGDKSRIEIEYDKFYKRNKEKFDNYTRNNKFFISPVNNISSLNKFYIFINKKNLIIHNILPFNNKNEINFKVNSLINYESNYERFRKDIDNFSKLKYEIYFLSEYENELNEIKNTLKEKNINTEKIKFQKGLISSGFINHTLKIFYIQDYEFYGKIRVEHTKPKEILLTEKLDSIYDLKEGDYVVHIEKGIGIYRGIKSITNNNSTRDYIEIEFANKLKLYTPLDRINLIQKYIGAGNNKPTLSDLKSNEFQRVKKRVKKSIIDIAKELLEIYAIREKIKGFRFNKDTEWQKEMESSFPYKETEDQIKAIKEIKQDMESDKPMDRLLCGDVGYGKTEIAIRASFKAVMSGKQVAILVPTTILAQQHFYTFTERLMNYPIKIEMLSRLTSTSEQRRIIRELKEGKIDIIIGTHRLLSNDIKFKDIGLVIIDEEQKFGVLHKEKFKLLKSFVDVLTMSATPIPRTLYMALNGIRDISILDTAPIGRVPIETIINVFSPDIIRKAILQEIDRGGQIYFIHNRVRTINAMANYIKKVVPEARIAVAHGQMDPEELEIIMLDFIEKKFDVLVTTTIIESGIDIPDVQTIIINRADRFGLSQLYQLRGRVGRSSNKSYAYLLYPSEKSISETAYKRLSAIYEYTDLGSGYKIAVRDLELRGAGNIFGPQQHGNIMAIGLELYSKILSNAIKELKGEKIEEKVEPIIDFEYNAIIPDNFIPDVKTKIELYKRLNQANREEDLEELFEEIKDRFGKKIPLELINLFDIYYIKVYLKNINAEYIRIKKISNYEIIFEIKIVKVPTKWKDIKLSKLKGIKFYNNILEITVEKEKYIKNLKKKLPLLI